MVTTSRDFCNGARAVVTEQPLGDCSTIEDPTAIDEPKKAAGEPRK